MFHSESTNHYFFFLLKNQSLPKLVVLQVEQQTMPWYEQNDRNLRYHKPSSFLAFLVGKLEKR